VCDDGGRACGEVGEAGTFSACETPDHAKDKQACYGFTSVAMQTCGRTFLFASEPSDNDEREQNPVK
jgi:hypothetical protein